jgi:hypothetical protein
MAGQEGHAQARQSANHNCVTRVAKGRGEVHFPAILQRLHVIDATATDDAQYGWFHLLSSYDL